jgi:hypothetical protein
VTAEVEIVPVSHMDRVLKEALAGPEAAELFGVGPARGGDATEDSLPREHTQES